MYTFELRPGRALPRWHAADVRGGQAVARTLPQSSSFGCRCAAPFDTRGPPSCRSIALDVPHLPQGTPRVCSCTSWPAPRWRSSRPATRAAFPTAFNEEPIGSGPYRFKERRKGESVLLERFDGYWGKRPHYPLVQFRIVPEVATRESLLLANQVEVIIQPPLSDLPALQTQPAT